MFHLKNPELKSAKSVKFLIDPYSIFQLNQGTSSLMPTVSTC